MKTIVRLLPVAAVALALAACGSPDNGTAAPANAGNTTSSSAQAPSSVTPAPPTSGNGIAPGEPDPNGGSKRPGGNAPGVVMVLPASQVDTKELPNFGKEPQVSIGDGGRTLRITIGNATGCATMQGVVKQQNADGVWIALVPMDTPQGGERCAESMNQKPALVRLDAPLDKRVVHLSSSF
ncbi:hypothetical protein [Labedaea rhizosphaerae]|uniref:Secreted protein n=1 Tax=Labedaea rhizosphaerae TaxID=598644 RepID=A0A4R6RY45_LABRH|nr:hypothetical protein [Labedaea rhizosphaerae]TDP92039.1 hypothetical protein EV186_108252 [Labedaea rhizosphaerae]